jgi:hypothetical protein
VADLIRALAAGLASEAITHEELLGHVRNGASKPQKKQGIVDGWYVDASEDAAEDKWIFEAARATGVSGWPDGEHSCEALGPRIQGNPLKLPALVCVPFNRAAPVYQDVPRSCGDLLEVLASLESRYSPGHLAEGIVFHHHDGRRANTEIIQRLHISMGTVKTHIGRLLAKLEARDRAQLVIAAYDAGLARR